MFYDIIAEIKDERIILSYCFGRRYGVLLASVTVFINFIKIFIFIDDFYKLMCYYCNVVHLVLVSQLTSGELYI